MMTEFDILAEKKQRWEDNKKRAERQAHLDKIKTKNGGYKREDLAAIGVPWPPPSGWAQRYLWGIKENAQA